MAEGVGRVQHVHSPPEGGSVRAAEEEIPEESLAGGNQLIGQDIPGPGLEPSGPHRLVNAMRLGRSERQIVLQQDRLPIEKKAGEPGIDIEPLDQVIQHAGKPRVQHPLREVPLAVPVGVGDEVEGEGHGSWGRREWRRA